MIWMKLFIFLIKIIFNVFRNNILKFILKSLVYSLSTHSSLLLPVLFYLKWNFPKFCDKESLTLLSLQYINKSEKHQKFFYFFNAFQMSTNVYLFWENKYILNCFHTYWYTAFIFISFIFYSYIIHICIIDYRIS